MLPLIRWYYHHRFHNRYMFMDTIWSMRKCKIRTLFGCRYIFHQEPKLRDLMLHYLSRDTCFKIFHLVKQILSISNDKQYIKKLKKKRKWSYGIKEQTISKKKVDLGFIRIMAIQVLFLWFLVDLILVTDDTILRHYCRENRANNF